MPNTAPDPTEYRVRCAEFATDPRNDLETARRLRDRIEENPNNCPLAHVIEYRDPGGDWEELA